MNSQIKITPKLKYKIKLEEGVYYPASADIKKDYVELMFYFPDEKKYFIELKSRCLDVAHLKHLSKSSLESNLLKLFIKDDFLKSIRFHEPFKFSESKIKVAEEIKGFEKYFDIFR